jgi:hypothetical protein
VELEELTTEEILQCINRGTLATIKFGDKSLRELHEAKSEEDIIEL